MFLIGIEEKISKWFDKKKVKIICRKKSWKYIFYYVDNFDLTRKVWKLVCILAIQVYCTGNCEQTWKFIYAEKCNLTENFLVKIFCLLS